MRSRTGSLAAALLLIAGLATAGCSDRVHQIAGPEAVSDSVNGDLVSTAVRWNQRAVALVVARQPASKGHDLVGVLRMKSGKMLL